MTKEDIISGKPFQFKEDQVIKFRVKNWKDGSLWKEKQFYIGENYYFNGFIMNQGIECISFDKTSDNDNPWMTTEAELRRVGIITDNIYELWR